MMQGVDMSPEKVVYCYGCGRLRVSRQNRVLLAAACPSCCRCRRSWGAQRCEPLVGPDCPADHIAPMSMSFPVPQMQAQFDALGMTPDQFIGKVGREGCFFVKRR